MRTITFEVSTEVIWDFAEKLTEMELDNSIVGKTDDDGIEIEVRYEKDEAKQVDELEIFLNQLNESLSDDEEEEEEEEEEQDNE